MQFEPPLRCGSCLFNNPKNMFITLTINTAKQKKSFISLQKSRLSPANSWRKAINAKKRGLWQRIRAWRRSLKDNCYRLGGQIAMF